MNQAKNESQDHLIFICYRRSDLSLEAEWLYQFICTFFGDKTAYFDKESESGKPWDLSLQNYISNAPIVLILIGPKWLIEHHPDSGIRRLDDPEDWVYQEVLTALKSFRKGPSERWIFSVLINNAVLPKREWLPTELGDLPFFQIEKKLQFNIKNYLEVAEGIYDFFKNKLLLLNGGLLPNIEIRPFTLEKVPNPYELREYQLPKELRFLRPENPFKGLEHFKREDARIFFGRKKEIGELLDLLKKSHNVIRLYGQSGVGKSSFLFAGLLPRLESNGWNIKYIRRIATKELGKNVKELITELHNGFSIRSLIIVDQVEEIITNPNSEINSELEDLARVIQELEEMNYKILTPVRLILSYRKEYDVEIKNALHERSVISNQYWLRSLSEEGMREAIKGITDDQYLMDEYHLQMEVGLDNLIITELLDKGSKQDATPLLQFLLRKMWNNVYENDIDTRIFTKKLYEECKNADLQDLLSSQLKEVSKKDITLYGAVVSGLALDVLKCFASEANTSVGQTEEMIMTRYSDEALIRKLLQALIDTYLLVRHEKKTYRLPHDSLAKAVIGKYYTSQLAGQRAARLLDSKRLDIQDIEAGEKSALDVKFSETDLTIIDEGKKSMRKLSEVELRLINASLQEILKTKQQLEERAHELEMLNARLEQSNRQLEEFASIASHDLKEPLRKILTFTSRLKEELVGATSERSNIIMDKIIRSSQRMQRLIDDLFAFSTLGGKAETFEVTDLNVTLQKVISDMETQIMTENATIHAEQLPTLDAIPLQMRQLFQNLLNNAIKFRKEDVAPVITITSRKLSEHERNNDGIDNLSPEFAPYEIIFSDNGIGFDPKYSNHIFNVFQRLPSNKRYEGNGIGLAICKKIVENHCGKVYATSTEGQGSSFHIILPENPV